METTQGVCLKCGGSFDYGNTKLDDQLLGYECECEDCGFVGVEWYYLNFIGYYDNDGNEVDKQNDNDPTKLT